MKKEYLCELIEECLHNMERECDLVGDEERVKKLEKFKETKCDGEACRSLLLQRDIFDSWKEMANGAHDNSHWRTLTN